MIPSVSIIVPCYNVAAYVDACLESLTGQTLADIEIICVNDGSTDGTPERLEDWAGRDDRIRVIHRENGGLSAARNTGLEVAVGEYVGFLDSDDYADRSMYARLLKEARRHDADVAACGYAAFSDRGGQVMEERSLSPAAGVDADVKGCVYGGDCLWERCGTVVWNKLFRRAVLEGASVAFLPEFRAGEDDVFRLMLLPHVSRLAVISDRLCFYRQREGSISSQWGNGCPCDLDMDRLECVTAYWKGIGWLGRAKERGWLVYVLKRFLLSHVTSGEEVFLQLDRSAAVALAQRCRAWFGASGLAPGFEGLRPLDLRFCLMLNEDPHRVGMFMRLWHGLLSLSGGRKGRLHRLKLALGRLS